ncbi:hypothetical protein VKT23_012562 [Stygiomarasmius scandens]|uniref:SET domain-containing protein n=1 Tax=Marasmiellus scandens TaxID=2682957 RepID=A0ABR1J8V4_9AGAR
MPATTQSPSNTPRSSKRHTLTGLITSPVSTSSMPHTHKRSPSTGTPAQSRQTLPSKGAKSGASSDMKRKSETEQEVPLSNHKRRASQAQIPTTPSHSRRKDASSASTSSRPVPASPKKKPIRDHEQSSRVQVVYFSSPNSQSTSFSLREPKGKIERIRFKNPEEECLVHVPGFSAAGVRPGSLKPSPYVPHNENILVLPVGGPASGQTPYSSIDEPLSIVVSSGVLSGLGVFARRPIRQGTVILVERPAMIVEDVADAEEVFTKLKKDVKDLAESLMDFSVLRGACAKGVIAKSPKGIVATNAFEVELEDAKGETRKCKALFPHTARCNHSCGPSAIATFDPASLTLTLHANRDLHPGDEITVSYLPISSSSASMPFVPSSPPMPMSPLLGFIPNSPSGGSCISDSTTTSNSTISSLLSSSSSESSSNTPAIYLPRHSRRRILHQVYSIECRCEQCDIPWTEADGVHKSDRARRELFLHNLALSGSDLSSAAKLRNKLGIPTFEEWCGNPSIATDALIGLHKRLLEMREKEGLELAGLANPFVSGVSSSVENQDLVEVVKEEGWLKHVDVLGMCYGALGKEKEFRRWVKEARDVRRAMCGGGSGETGLREQIEHVKVLDTWLDEPRAFPLWGWRVQSRKNLKAR